jgi:glutamine amidotransferase
MIVIIDYGLGNLNSILNKFERMGFNAIISSDIEDIEKAEKLILPGVGSFNAGMENLRKQNLISILNKKVISDKIPILGICLGMQLFTKKSEEGNVNGLGWIDAETKRFEFERRDITFRIPHMGWNTIKIKTESSLLEKIDENSKFYFVHSYHVFCNDENDIIAKTNYGYDFPSIIQKGNIFGIQFHPERSQKIGLNLLKNFAGDSNITT